MGDAINWEWMIYVSEKTGADLCIVSRDSDYGVQYDGEMFLNDWLRDEFKDRVSRKRKIFLYSKLTEALKTMKVEVTTPQEEEEDVISKISYGSKSISPIEMINGPMRGSKGFVYRMGNDGISHVNLNVLDTNVKLQCRTEDFKILNTGEY